MNTKRISCAKQVTDIQKVLDFNLVHIEIFT